MFWSFGIVNNRLAEVFFERDKGKVRFLGHAYVEESEYKTKSEKRWMQEDTEKVRLTYRKGAYKPRTRF